MNIHREDLIRFIKKSRKRSAWISIVLFFVSASAILFFKEPRYSVKAVFKQATSQTEQTKELLNRFIGGNHDETISARSLLQSRKLIGEVVDTLGLQVVVKKRESIFHRALENIAAEFRKPLFDQHRWSISRVHYVGEKTIKKSLQPLGPKAYKIDGKTGVIAEQFSGQDFWLYIDKIPDNASEKDQLDFLVLPREKMIDQMQKRLHIQTHRDEKALLKLSFSHRDRHFAAAFLNCLIAVYENYLKLENHRLAKAQLNYLTMRESMLTNHLEESLLAYRNELQKTIQSGALLTVKDEVIFHSQRKKQMEDLFFDLQMEEEELEKQRPFLARSSPVADQLAVLQEQKLKLENEKERSAAAILFPPEDQRLSLMLQKEQLKDKKNKTEKYPNQSHFTTFPYLISVDNWVQKRRDALAEISQEKQRLEQIKDQLPVQDYLKIIESIDHYQHLLEINPFYSGGEGLDLESTKQYLLDYSKELDKTQIELTRNEELLEEIKKNKKPLSSFHILMPDTLSSDSAKIAHQIEKQLADTKNLTELEIKRLKDSLKRERKELVDHLTHLQVVTTKRAEIIRAKLSKLKESYHHYLHHEIQLLDQKKQSLITERKQQINAELQFVKGRLDEMQKNLETLPDRWYWENLLKLKTALNQSIIEGLSKIVETKTVEHHIKQIESKLIDIPYLPGVPNMPFVFPLAFLIAIFGTGVDFFVRLFFSVQFGLPVSQKRLEEEGIPVCKKDQWTRYINHSCSVLTLLAGKKGIDLSTISHCFAAGGKEVTIVMIQPTNRDLFKIYKIHEKKYEISLPVGHYECLYHHDYCEFFGKISQQSDVVVVVFLQTTIQEINTQVITESCDQILAALEEETYADVSTFMRRIDGRASLLFLA